MLNTFQQADHPILPKATSSERSRQEFVKTFKGYIQQDLLPKLPFVYERQAAPAYARKNGAAPKDRRQIRAAMVGNPYFQTYASAQRISQEMQWSSVLASISRQLEDMQSRAKTLEGSVGSLRLNPDMPMPRYVTELDIHCMPGGYVGEDLPGDIISGALYDRGVYLYAMGFMGPYNDDIGRSVANYITRHLPDLKPKRILDLGCSVGHSTLPYKQIFPEAEVIGADVSAPMLRYAHLRAAGLGADVAFEQENAERTSYPDESFDLVVSHILLHETSGKAMPKIFEESYRLLKPGGYMIHADLPPFEKMDEFTRFILDNETHYNNEPFWSAMREIDQIGLAEKVGFKRADIRFDTAPMAVMEFAAAAEGYDADALSEVADREFAGGEFGAGGWEVLIARKEAQ